MLRFIVGILVTFAVVSATDCDSITSQSACASAKCSWCTSAAVGDSCVSTEDAAALPSSVFTCSSSLSLKNEIKEKLFHHGDMDAIAKSKKLEGTFFNVTVTSSASSYESDPFGYTTLYHSEVAYCGDSKDNQPSYMDRDYNTNSYTKTFEPTLYVHSDNSKDSLRGYIGYQSNINAIIVSFRGSEDLNNWITNLSFARTDYNKCSGCSAHSGFLSAANSLYPQIQPEVARLASLYPGASIVVTGHSLGAALATLTALNLIEDHGSRVKLYNYGCPRIFNQAAADWASSGVLSIGARRTHYKDIVVHSPAYAMGFVHTSGEIYENGPMSDYPTWPGGPLQSCQGEEDKTCADQFNVGAVSDHLLYSGFTLGTDGCDQL